MRELQGLPRMTITLNPKELTKITFSDVSGVCALNYGGGSVYVSASDEAPIITGEVINATLLLKGAGDSFHTGCITGHYNAQYLWLYALDTATVTMQAGIIGRAGMSYGGTGDNGSDPPKPPILLKNGEIPIFMDGEMVGSGMVVDNGEVNFNNNGIKHLSPHSIQFGDPVTLSSDGVGMVVHHANDKRRLALAGAFVDDNGSDGVYYPHYGKRVTEDAQTKDFSKSIKTPQVFTSERDVTIYGYELKINDPSKRYNNWRIVIYKGAVNIKPGNVFDDDNEHIVLAESLDETEWLKDKGEGSYGVESVEIKFTNGFLYEQGKEYTICVMDYNMDKKVVSFMEVLGDVDSVPWGTRDCQPCEIKKIIEGTHYATGQEMDEVGRKWMENMDHDPPRTTVFNTDIMCYCNLIANRKVKPFFTWYAVTPPTVLSYDEVGGDDFRFLRSLAEDGSDVKWAGYNYMYRDDLYCWIPRNFRTIDTESIELGNLRITPPSTQSKSLFLNSNGGWSEPPYPAPPVNPSDVETVLYQTNVSYISDGNLYVVSKNNDRQTWEYCVGLTVMAHDTSGKPPNDNKWRNMVMFEWDSASQVIAGRGSLGDNSWLKDGMEARMFMTYAKKEDTTPDVTYRAGLIISDQTSDMAKITFTDINGQFKEHYSTDRLATQVWYYKLIAVHPTAGERSLSILSTDKIPVFTFKDNNIFEINTYKFQITADDQIFFKAQWKKNFHDEQPLMRSMSMPVQEEPVKLGMIDSAIQSVKSFLS